MKPCDLCKDTQTNADTPSGDIEEVRTELLALMSTSIDPSVQASIKIANDTMDFLELPEVQQPQTSYEGSDYAD